MAKQRKFYVVWVGWNPGIYDSWEECKAQVENFPGAKFKAFADQDSATAAYRGNSSDHIGLLRSIASYAMAETKYAAFPEIILESIAVDAACSKNPGPMEYRGVNVRTGKEVFHIGPLEDGTNNVGEYLAIVHALALLDKRGDPLTSIYSDSKTALSWIKLGKHRSSLRPTPRNARIFEMLRRADAWLAAHAIKNRILKWDTDRWGEIPADFGRK